MPTYSSPIGRIIQTGEKKTIFRKLFLKMITALIISPQHAERYALVKCTRTKCKRYNIILLIRFDKVWHCAYQWQWVLTLIILHFSIQSDQQKAVFYAGIGEGTAADWDKAWEEIKYTVKQDYRDALLYGLSAAQEPWVIRRYEKQKFSLFMSPPSWGYGHT